MKQITKFFAIMLLACSTVNIYAQSESPNRYAQSATSAKTFRLYNDPTHSISIAAGNTEGRGTFTFPQPASGIFKSNGSGMMSISAIDLGTSDITNILNVSNGGTGTASVGSPGTVVVSNGAQFAYTSVGSSGQVLTSNGTGTPTWTTVAPAKFIGRIRGDGTTYSYTITPPPGSGYSTSSIVMVSIESPMTQTASISSKTSNSFTIQTADILTSSEFINFVIY